MPETGAYIKSEVRCLTAAIGRETVGTPVGRSEIVRVLLDVRRLPVDGVTLIGRRTRVGRLGRSARIVSCRGAGREGPRTGECRRERKGGKRERTRMQRDKAPTAPHAYTARPATRKPNLITDGLQSGRVLTYSTRV